MRHTLLGVAGNENVGADSRHRLAAAMAACNGIYLNAGDLSLSSLAVTPLDGHVAGRFRGWPH